MAAKSTVLVVASLALALLAGAAKAEDKSLYQRLGGYDAIAAVSDEFIARLTNDEQEKRFFIGLSTDSKSASANCWSTLFASRPAARASIPAAT